MMWRVLPEVALVVSARIILCMQESSQHTARLEAKKRKLWKGLYADLNRLALLAVPMLLQDRHE